MRDVFNFAQERTNRVARFIKIINAYKQGQPIKDIVHEYDCSRSTVLRYARLAGLAKRVKGFDPEIKQATIAMVQQGKPYAEIQALLGVSQAYISKEAKKAGLNRYSRS